MGSSRQLIKSTELCGLLAILCSIKLLYTVIVARNLNLKKAVLIKFTIYLLLKFCLPHQTNTFETFLKLIKNFFIAQKLFKTRRNYPKKNNPTCKQLTYQPRGRCYCVGDRTVNVLNTRRFGRYCYYFVGTHHPCWGSVGGACACPILYQQLSVWSVGCYRRPSSSINIIIIDVLM